MVHEIKPVDGELGDLLNKTMTHEYRKGWITVNGCVMPEYYENFADAIENFDVRDDDIWVCSIPKGGTTWTQEMIWSIMNDLDSEEAKLPLTHRFPFLEVSTLFDFAAVSTRDNLKNPVTEAVLDSVSFAAKLPSPRFIKSHLPFDLLPRQIRTGDKKPKIVYVARNPKDVCISFFHHCELIEGFFGDFDDFVNLFIGDKLHFLPYWANVLSYWGKRLHDNVLFLKYEDMKRDLPSVIKTTAKFLGENLTSDRVTILINRLSFASMKANTSSNNADIVSSFQEWFNIKQEGVFIRTGTSEQWKSEMSPQVIQRFDDWTQENTKGTGLSF